MSNLTSEISFLEQNTLELVDAIIESKRNFIVIQPNNDPGTEIIQKIYSKKLNISQCKYFPSIRFEYFLTLLKNADLIIGNSSAGIREAPFFGVPSINIGTRQRGRSHNPDIINLTPKKSDILSSLKRVKGSENITNLNEFGFDMKQSSSHKFMQVLNSQQIWEISIQKIFNETPDV